MKAKDEIKKAQKLLDEAKDSVINGYLGQAHNQIEQANLILDKIVKEIME